MNPFRVRQDDTPGRPLCPWKEPADDDWYVDVDGAEAAYQEFQRSVGNLNRVREDGLLVLVTGAQGCGKTALIHRCAHWVRQVPKSARAAVYLVDLTRDGSDRRERKTVEQRMFIVYNRLLDKLKAQQADITDLETLEQYRERPELGFPYLSDTLVDGHFAVVLLPPSELGAEVERYADLVRGQVLLIVESSYLDQADVRKLGLDGRAQIPSLHLELGPLRPGDCRTFMKDRLGRHDGNSSVPTLADETIRDVEEVIRQMSVGTLQKILHDTYEAVREESPPVTAVTLLHIMRSMSQQLSQRSSSP